MALLFLYLLFFIFIAWILDGWFNAAFPGATERFNNSSQGIALHWIGYLCLAFWLFIVVMYMITRFTPDKPTVPPLVLAKDCDHCKGKGYISHNKRIVHGEAWTEDIKECPGCNGQKTLTT